MHEELAKAIKLAQAASTPPPSNEPETCFRIIDPLLRAMGYGYQDIKVQDRDNARQRPDYSILQGAPDFTWFLEAKAWDVNLNDDHAIQAVNYANTQGKRWVVLSNGRDWRLYDNHLLGTVEVKRASVAQLGDEAFISFLEALSKLSIEQGKLERFVQNERLFTYLTSQVTRPESAIVRSIVKVLRSTPGLTTVTAAEVVGFWRNYASGSPNATHEAEIPASLVPVPVPVPVTGDVPVPVARMTAAGGSFVLGGLGSAEITGAKIRSLTLPDGRSIPVLTWNQLTVQVTLFLLEQGRMPTPPFFMSPRAKCPLVAKSGSPESQRMIAPQSLPAPYTDWLVEGNFSAASHQSASVNLLRATGFDPATFRIEI